MVPLDTIERMERDRGSVIDLPKITKQKRLDWDQLRAKVKGGMRNATLMAVAPNANIGLVAGTTPGIDPRFAQVFARNKISGKYMDINHNLVKDLKNMGLWDDVKEKIIEAQGDISQVDGLPGYFKEIYKTAFTTNPYAYIEVAARAQKWVDQALSRNMYLDSRDMADMKQIYFTAWQKGLKTTYYLHMKPRHTAEQSTTNVNKSEMTGKRGFGSIKLAAAGIPADATLSPVEMNPSPMHVDTPAPTPVYVAATPAPHQGFAAVAANITETPVAAAPSQPAAVSETIVLGTSTPTPIQTTPIQTPVVAAAPATEQRPSAPMGFSAVKAEMPTPRPVAAPIVASAPATAPQAASQKPFVCPVDPQERLLCDACQ